MKTRLKQLYGILALLWGLVTIASGAPIKIAAEKVPEETVTEMHIYQEDVQGAKQFLQSLIVPPPGNPEPPVKFLYITVDLPPGKHRLYASFYNGKVWGPFSDVLEVEVPATPDPTPAPQPVPVPSKPKLRVIPIYTAPTPDPQDPNRKINGYYVVNPEPDGTYPPTQFITTEAILVEKP